MRAASRNGSRAIAACIAVALSACSTGSAVEHRIASIRPVSQANGSLDGVWQNRANGWLLRIENDRYELFDVTQSACVAADGWSGALSENWDRFAVIDQDTIALHEPLKRNHVRYERRADFPAKCLAPQTRDPMVNWTAFEAYLIENYYLAGDRPRDLSRRLEQARARVREDMDERELFELMAEVLVPLRDGHAQIAAEIDGAGLVAGQWQGPTLEKAGIEDEANRAIDPEAPSFLTRYRRHVMETVLHGKGTYVANNRIAFGWADEESRIGYISTVIFQGYAGQDADWAAEIAALDEAMRLAMAELSGAHAIIVDVSNHRGGISVVAQRMAEWFAPERMAAARIVSPLSDDRHTQTLVLEPAKDAYAGPVFLLTSDVTISGGERFAVMMRALPNVVHVGGRTRGALSKILPKTLPNGWQVWLTNQDFRDIDDVSWEGKGIEPEVEISVFDSPDPLAAHGRAIREIIEIAK